MFQLPVAGNDVIRLPKVSERAILEVLIEGEGGR